MLFVILFPTDTFLNSSSCYVGSIIWASPCGLFLHTAVWVTHQKEDSRSRTQKDTRKGLQHIEPINSTPLAGLTFGGVSHWCNWRCKGCCVGDDKIPPYYHRAKYYLCCYVNNSLQHNSVLYFLVFFTIALSEGCYGCSSVTFIPCLAVQNLSRL